MEIGFKESGNKRCNQLLICNARILLNVIYFFSEIQDEAGHNQIPDSLLGIFCVTYALFLFFSKGV